MPGRPCITFTSGLHPVSLNSFHVQRGTICWHKVTFDKSFCNVSPLKTTTKSKFKAKRLPIWSQTLKLNLHWWKPQSNIILHSLKFKNGSRHNLERKHKLWYEIGIIRWPGLRATHYCPIAVMSDQPCPVSLSTFHKHLSFGTEKLGKSVQQTIL